MSERADTTALVLREQRRIEHGAPARCPDCGEEIAARDFPASPTYGTKCRCYLPPRPDLRCHICVLLGEPAEHDYSWCPIGPNERYYEALQKERQRHVQR